ncbi:hypothetical protein [Vagococcus fluvialis]|uniref:hypothetical protein n=1 Tax=Vagococcus fluvialis TaxID=2738 RepID=UPI003B226471
MNDYWKEYCKYVAKVTGKSMEQVSDSMRRLMQAGIGKGVSERFRLAITEVNRLAESEEKIIGNKRNGTQDRRQAFGGLF